VNAGSGTVADVLLINGGSGDGLNELHVNVGTYCLIRMEAPPGGPATADFALYAYMNQPDDATQTVHPYGIGLMCFPTPISGGSPIPITVANTVHPALGFPFVPCGPAPTIVASFTVPAPMNATFQGFIFDYDSGGPGFSITNAIVLKAQ
jgi:hypothetical protein